MRLIPYISKSEVPSRLWPETSRFFEDFFNDFPLSNSIAHTGEKWAPTVDILEKEGNLILRAELPGMTEKEIDLKLEGDTLTLKGERKMEGEENKAKYHRVESYYGSFTRSFRLPETVDQKNKS